MPNAKHLVLSREQFDGVIFDLDGVVTQSAKVHAKAWKEMFDVFLKKKGSPPFDIRNDYAAYIDGKPRYEGVKSFLDSRGIDLPFGSEEDDPETETICGLGNRKNQLFLKYLKQDGVEVYQPTLDLIQSLKQSGFKVGLISSSKNCSAILKAAEAEGLFDVQIDGKRSAELGLKGKPEPDIFLKAAEFLGIDPKRAVVIEDALAGVKAGFLGGFGCVIGVDRGDKAENLKKEGADVIVKSLSEVEVVL